MLSIVVPAYNESENIGITARALIPVLEKEGIPHEVLVVNDNSSDGTELVLQHLQTEFPTIRYVTNPGPNGFGYAVRYGLEHYQGDMVAIMMADLSDAPEDLVRFYKVMNEKGTDCVFGHRWIRGGLVVDYPATKRIINRMVNNLIGFLLNVSYTDSTNAFKLYRRKTIEGLGPFLSPHFNLTIELPLKAIIRGYTYEVVPNSWKNRKYGKSNLRIQEMGSRYFFILLYVLIEKYFSRGDFKKKW